MESRIKNFIKLKNQPVAVIQVDELNEKVLQFKPGQWGCVAAMLVAAANGKVAAFSKDTATCIGGRAGLGFEKYPLGWIEYFLSCGSPTVERCEHYKQTPELAKNFIENISNSLIEKLPPRKKFLFLIRLKFFRRQHFTN